MSELHPQQRRVNPNPLATLAADIREHWDEFLPGRVAALKAAGTYEAAVAEAVAQTESEYDEEVANGMHPLAAWEAVRQRYAFLPAEPGAGEDDDDLWVDDEEDEDDEDDPR